MKINEVCSHLKSYLASVRVVLPHGSMNSRTTIKAETGSQAFAMLTRAYGVGNVLSLVQIVTESSRTYQIQQEAAISDQSIHTQHPVHENAQIQTSQLRTPVASQQQPSTRAIPTELKHRLVQGQLSKKFLRQSNIVKPSNDDIRIAHDRVATELKRTDLEHQRDMDRMLRKQKRL